jgi:hypothetical protein
VLKRLYDDEGELGDLVHGAFDVVVSKRLDNMEISPLTGAAYNRARQLLDDEDEDDADRDDDTFEKIFTGKAGGADVAKAHAHRGQHELAASLIQHLHDRLDRHRERHGYYKTFPPVVTRSPTYRLSASQIRLAFAERHLKSAHILL